MKSRISRLEKLLSVKRKFESEDSGIAEFIQRHQSIDSEEEAWDVAYDIIDEFFEKSKYDFIDWWCDGDGEGTSFECGFNENNEYIVKEIINFADSHGVNHNTIKKEEFDTLLKFARMNYDDVCKEYAKRIQSSIDWDLNRHPDRFNDGDLRWMYSLIKNSAIKFTI